ncbi:hypothetical protein GCM10010967_25870 [Dyadobacter beijingensis]|uniref:Competence protein ComEC n=1 Tax=Dyadobacter beijingensis TaxID=365489 RepID=A0ABQ2HU36_9BACT|nr:ComEC/Rec2 family competence protein [Dyadobacter beijingensis]GGM91645.1 hypothetical protein GCM10010967_25870 [Dyadobacter beijingensis]
MLSRAPFVSVVIFLATGILAGDALRHAADVPVVWLLVPLLSAGAACLLFYFWHFKTAFAVSLCLWMAVLGATIKIGVEQEKDRQLHAVGRLKYHSYTAEVSTLPEKRSKSIRFEVKTGAFYDGRKWIDNCVRALLYLPDSLAVLPKPGDRLIIYGHLQIPDPPHNPAQFDYAHYLRNKGILFTAFVKSGSYALISDGAKAGDTHISPAYWPEAVSQWADDRFREHITGQTGADSAAYGLVKAMLLGRRDDLRDEQVSDYVGSGAVHILSVSGMHVAIIFLAISAAFGWLRRWNAGKWLYLLLMAALLGFYGLVTGLPPSVQRAALMCMVLVCAEVAGRKQHSMNTLAFSALIILLLDPCALYDVGFQLSYLAMAGIFLLYDPVYQLFSSANRVVRFIWQVTVLALAAQMATFPLSIYYFHQFPVYFWLVNPLVVIFTNVLLPAALILLLVSAAGISGLAWLAGKVVAVSAWLTDWSASIPGMLPGHLLENLHLNALETGMLYVLIFVGWCVWHTRAIRVFKAWAVLVVLFSTFSISVSCNTYFTTECVAFQMPKHHVVCFKSGNRLYLVSDQAFVQDTRAFDFYVKNYAVEREVAKILRYWTE